jgi:hypothetical protein
MVNENKFTFLQLKFFQEWSTEMRTADPDVIRFKKGEILKYWGIVIVLSVVAGSNLIF